MPSARRGVCHPILTVSLAATGMIDREARKATWKVGTGATFGTTLDALLTTPSTVTMKAGSTSQIWDLVRMEKPETVKP